jgi:hypothetical protein
VELSGIELVAEIQLTCGKLTTRNNVKQREMTCGYAKGVDGINTYMRSVSAHEVGPSPGFHVASVHSIAGRPAYSFHDALHCHAAASSARYRYTVAWETPN